MRLALSSLVLFALAPAAVGCAGTIDGSGSSTDAEAASTRPVVVVDRAIDSTNGSRAEASARFVRVSAHASLDEALRAIGAGLDLPATGQCASTTSRADEGSNGEAAPVVELVDVGTVSLEVDGVETRLVPRQLPDVTDVVSGIVYARAADPALLPAAARYVVHVRGRTEVDPFDASIAAPADPGNVRIAGEDESGNVVARGTSVDLAWPVDGTRDGVYADVLPAGVRCLLGDGAGTASALGVGADGLVHGAVPASLLDDAGTLIVHRVHREALRAPGMQSGEVRFDFARAVAYVRR